MEVKAIAKAVRISPIRTRLVADLIRGKNVVEARSILENMGSSKAAKIILTTLNSAISNAVNNNGLIEKDLYVTQIFINQGAVMKRIFMDSRSHIGRRDHKTSHINVFVGYKN